MAELYASRPRSRFVFASLCALAALSLFSWCSGDFTVSDLFSPRRIANMSRFLREITPHAWRETHSAIATADSLWELLSTRGFEAMWHTLLLSIAGISLAGTLALLIMPFVANTLARPRPYEERDSLGWRCLHGLGRLLLVLARAMPEYIWAFLFVAILGANAWPLVLALGLHNCGILGRLGAEVMENMERSLPQSMTALGQSRLQLYLASLLPAALPKLLVYFFYRWETCVRDATVLGMLGISSLGYAIRDARSRQLHDEMLIFILLGSLLVILGDALSGWVRRRIRQ